MTDDNREEETMNDKYTSDTNINTNNHSRYSATRVIVIIKINIRMSMQYSRSVVK